jgi:hypothetical protein
MRFSRPSPPKPDHLGVGSGTHATGKEPKVMIAYERVLGELRPDLVSCGGDVNSTMAQPSPSKMGTRLPTWKQACDPSRTMPRRSTGWVTDVLADISGHLRSMRMKIDPRRDITA